MFFVLNLNNGAVYKERLTIFTPHTDYLDKKNFIKEIYVLIKNLFLEFSPDLFMWDIIYESTPMQQITWTKTLEYLLFPSNSWLITFSLSHFDHAVREHFKKFSFSNCAINHCELFFPPFLMGGLKRALSHK